MENNKKIVVLQGVYSDAREKYADEYSMKHHFYLVSRAALAKYYLADGLDDIEESKVKIAINLGYNILINSANIRKERIDKWNNMANDNGYDIEFHQIYVPYSEALKLNSDSKIDILYRDRVGKKALYDFYATYFMKEMQEDIQKRRKTVPYDNEIPNCVISDLDETLALHQGRNPFDWSKIPEDLPDLRLLKLLNMFSNNNVHIFFVTGRPEKARSQTIEWLNKYIPQDYYGVKWDLLMKPDNDYVSGDIAKQKLYENNIKGQYNVLQVFEDSNKCVAMWRNEGLFTSQVENNEY